MIFDNRVYFINSRNFENNSERNAVSRKTETRLERTRRAFMSLASSLDRVPVLYSSV